MSFMTILAKFSFCIFMGRDDVELHKNAKRERGQFPAILMKLAYSVKDLLYGIPCLLVALCSYFCVCWFLFQNVLKSIFLFSLFSFSLTLSGFSFSGSNSKQRNHGKSFYHHRNIFVKENFRVPTWT